MESIAQQNNVKVKIPKVVESGTEAILHCSFDLGGEKLYQVKWYRNGEEFYRFTPSAQEYPIQIYPRAGIHIDEHESKPNKIVLKDVSREMTGLFACEVTAEQTFFTDIGTQHLQVVDLPARNPYITGLKKRYIVNDTLIANCTSEFSYPGANITWYINDAPHFGPTVSNHNLSDGQYITTYSILRLLITSKYLINSQVMDIKCTAIMYNIYNKSTTHIVHLWDRRRKHKNRNTIKHFDFQKIQTTTAESQLEIPEVPDYEEHHNRKNGYTVSWILSKFSSSSAYSQSTELILLNAIVVLNIDLGLIRFTER